MGFYRDQVLPRGVGFRVSQGLRQLQHQRGKLHALPAPGPPTRNSPDPLTGGAGRRPVESRH